MDALVKAVGPVFVAGLAIQQLLELLDSIVGKSLGDKKPMVFSIVSLVVGLALSFGIGLRVLHPLGLINVSFALDAVVTGVIISAGTEGINSIMKFSILKKEARISLFFNLHGRRESKRRKPHAVIK